MEPGALQLMKNGRLPLDIKALHSVCLFGFGGQDYSALTNLEQVILSSDMDLFSSYDMNTDVTICIDPQWMAFSKYFNAPVNKTFLLSSIADIVAERSGDSSRSKRVLDIFTNHVRALDNVKGKDKGLEEALTSTNELDRAHTIKFVLSLLQLMVNCTKADLAALNGTGKEEPTLVENVSTDSVYTLQTMLRFQSVLWNPRYSDWSLPETSKAVSSRVSGC